MSDTRFDISLRFVLKSEGGFVDDPDDPGGATNKGITQAVYDGFRQHKGEARQSVRLITDAEVADIYRSNYWDAAKCGSLPPPLDLVVFDAAVNMGVGTSVKFLQGCLHVAADGHFGPGTAAAVEAHKHQAESLAHCCLASREARFHDLVVRNPKLRKFLKGWLNRLSDLRKTAGVE